MKREGFFSNDAGEKFFFVENVPEDRKAAVLAVHGYAEHTGRYGHVSDYLASRGFSFHMMENRGHGRSAGRKGHIERYDDFLDDLDVFRKMVERSADEAGVPLFMLGHSNGSLISARYVLSRGRGVRGLVLSGIPIRTAVKVNPLKLKVGFFLAGIAPRLTLPTELDPYTLCHDAEVTREYVEDPLVHKVMSVGFAKEFFGAMEDLLGRAADFTHPVLFLHGSDDRACDAAAAVEFHDRISSQDREIIVYEDLWHEVFNEPEKEKILDTAVRWMEDRLEA